ncbi:hypothetical protein G4B88_024220 [Cannabis sativa]|uniref:Uncharacterized protein n=1 Tax=Cannabis sativa TaxID=3483 RepID=A0A7J6FPQ9_CANSA|nr:hypothetical protein G4B88_024220 [Cannabis sativa]
MALEKCVVLRVLKFSVTLRKNHDRKIERSIKGEQEFTQVQAKSSPLIGSAKWVLECLVKYNIKYT